ncbi:MAG TPA: hypothetical protein VD866_08660 [Urbifossiella sp.]|nr:hypothetical protein [Urbifossiella sp.]
MLSHTVAVPVGSGTADDLPPGVHFNTDGRVATVVFEVTGPDTVVMFGPEGRLVLWGGLSTLARRTSLDRFTATSLDE